MAKALLVVVLLGSLQGLCLAQEKGFEAEVCPPTNGNRPLADLSSFLAGWSGAHSKFLGAGQAAGWC